MGKKRLNLGAVRKLAMADPPVTKLDAAKELGVHTQTYALARDLVYLMEEDLTNDEWLEVTRASYLLSDIKVSKAREILEPIIFHHFGNHTPKQGGRAKARDAAVVQFLTSVMNLTASLEAADEITVPYLPRSDRPEVISGLKRGIKSIKRLIHVIEQGGSHNADDQE